MDLQPQNKKIQFPVSFKLKIICIIHSDEQSAFTRFDKILDHLNVNHSGWDSKPSSGGKYSSYRVDVTITDEQTFRNLYSELGVLDGVKCVI
jgi:putative lipoic acid-binding regulatory protein